MQASGRRRRRTGHDAGVNQSAFVALLIAVILVILAALGTYGPQIGGTIAQYWICKLVTDAPNCPGPTLPDPATSDDSGQPQVVTVFDNGPMAEELGIDPGDLADSIRDAPGALGASGLDVCDVAWRYATGYEMPGLPLPTELQEPGSCPGASVSVDDDGNVVVDVPDDEVHTELWKWVIQLIAGAIALGGSFVSFGICTELLGPGAVICPYVGGFFMGFLYSFAGQLLSGGSISDWDLWASAFVTGIISALPAANAPAWPVVKNAVVTSLKAVARALTRGAVRIGGWAHDFVTGVGAKLDDLVQRVQQAIDAVPPPT